MFNHEALDFEVEKFNLFHFGEQVHTNSPYKVPSSIGVGIRRKDTKQPLGIVSENYEIVQYMDIVDGVEHGDKLAYIYGRHTKNFNVDGFATKIQKAGEFIAGDGMNEMRTWYDTKVTRDQAINLFSKTLARRTDNVTRKKVANKVMLSNLMKTFDEESRHLHGRGNYDKYGRTDGGTMWSAYNAATWWSTHGQTRQGSSLHNAKPIREEKVRKMLGSDTWKELLDA
jgi:hypothetical protein